MANDWQVHVAVSFRDLDRLTRDVGPRPPGSEAEQQAAELIARILSKHSIPNTTIPFNTVRGIATIYLIPFLVLILSIPLAWFLPIGGFVLAAIAAVVIALEATSRPVISRVFSLDTSHNVIGLVPHSPQSGDPNEPPRRRVVVTAPIDSPRRGWLDSREMVKWSRGLTLLVIVSVAAVPLFLALNLFVDQIDGIPESVPVIVAAIPGLIVFLALIFLTQRDISGNPELGRNNNASGIVTALALAKELNRYPALGVETLFVFSGASQAGSTGMTNFLENNAFNPETTYFINVEGVGHGPICFTRSEGPLFPLQSSPALVHIAGDIALSNPKHLMRPVVRQGMPSEQYAALIRGYQAITIMGHPDPDTVSGPPGMVENDEIDPDAVESAYLLLHGIVRQLDDEVMSTPTVLDEHDYDQDADS